jgi:hypothetical protein
VWYQPWCSPASLFFYSVVSLQNVSGGVQQHKPALQQQ